MTENKTQVESKRICNACGTEFWLSEIKDNHCKICDDDRQYVPQTGQTWTTHEDLLKIKSVQIKPVRNDLFELTVLPHFAIGQRAFLVLSEHGNILWDCIPVLDESTVAFINSKGGLKAIGISHPHYYSNMTTWATVFNCPVYIHEKDQEWTHEKIHIHFWKGVEMPLWDGITIINTGGHFPGACVLLVPSLSEKGTLLCSDSLQISRSKKFISIMYSYPNQIPLPVSEISRIKSLMRSYQFDTLYGAFGFQNVTSDVEQLLEYSFEINVRGKV